MLPPPQLFTCTVGRKQSFARYLMSGSSEVTLLLHELSTTLREAAAQHPAIPMEKPAVEAGGVQNQVLTLP